MKSGNQDTYAVRLRLNVSPLPGASWSCYEKIRLVRRDGNDVQEGESLEDGSLSFEWRAKVTRDPETGRPRFRGPAMDRDPARPAVRLTWEALEDGTWSKFRGFKVLLTTVTWDQILRAADSPDRALTASVSGLSEGNSPACATRPLEGAGWTLEE